MRIVAKRSLKESGKKYPDAEIPLKIWVERITQRHFMNHTELKEVFPNADYIPNANFKHLTVFNIKRNEYRLAVDVFFNTGNVFIKWFGKHSDYDKVDFKKLKNRNFELC